MNKLRKILEAVAQGVITPEQAEWLLSDVKDIDVQSMESTLDKMMRGCYGYVLSRRTDTSSWYNMYNGDYIIDQISVCHDTLSVDSSNDDWVKGFKLNCKKYGLI